MFILLSPASQKPVQTLTDGVTGNTSDFGSEESRFEPWSVNSKVDKPEVKFSVTREFFFRLVTLLLPMNEVRFSVTA